jgi:hypothetical protein
LKRFAPKNEWFAPEVLWKKCRFHNPTAQNLALSLETFKYYMTLIKRRSLWEGLVRERKRGGHGKYYYKWDVDVPVEAEAVDSSDVMRGTRSPTTPEAVPKYVNPSSGTKFCSDCGGKIATSAKFCEHCGAKQSSNKVSVSVEQNSFDVKVPDEMQDPQEIWNYIVQRLIVRDVRIMQGDSGSVFHTTITLKGE